MSKQDVAVRHLPMPLQIERDTLARQFASGPVEQQSTLVSKWTADYGQTVARRLMLEGVAMVSWPEKVAAFREIWVAPNTTDAEIRDAITRLDDEQVARIAGLLRQMFILRPHDLYEVWQAAIDWAAEA